MLPNIQIRYLKILLFLISFCFCGPSCSQHLTGIDSLLHQLSIQPEDTFKVKTLTQISRTYLRKSDFTQSDIYLEKLKTLTTKLNYTPGLCHFYTISGI